jgi:hypothetical protein
MAHGLFLQKKKRPRVPPNPHFLILLFSLLRSRPPPAEVHAWLPELKLSVCSNGNVAVMMCCINLNV